MIWSDGKKRKLSLTTKGWRGTIEPEPPWQVTLSYRCQCLNNSLCFHHNLTATTWYVCLFVFFFFLLLALWYKSTKNPLFFFLPCVNFYRNFLVWFNFLGLGFCELVFFIEVNRIYKWNKGDTSIRAVRWQKDALWWLWFYRLSLSQLDLWSLLSLLFIVCGLVSF